MARKCPSVRVASRARSSASRPRYPDIPVGGIYGLTLELRNAHSLAWRLPAQVHGGAPFELLPAFGVSRSGQAAPHARELYFPIAGATIRLLQSLLEVLYV